MNTILTLCPYCGAYWYVKDETITNIGHKCNWCMNDGTLINTKHTDLYFASKYMTKDQYQLSEHLMNEYVRCNPLYSPEFEEKRLKAETYLNSQTNTCWRKLNFNIDETENIIQDNNNQAECQPHCPTCGSTDVEKISTGNKVGKAALFGLFSVGILTKTYKCRSCGYKW